MSDMTYEKRFRLTVVAKFVSEDPLNKVDAQEAQRVVQKLLDYAFEKFAEIPDWPGVVSVQAEAPPLQLSVGERVDKILRALERKGFDVS
jgi:hypothetical protein